MYFSKNLSYLRKSTDVSQAEVATALSLKRTTYANYENGTTEPPYEILIKIAKYLGVTIDDLLCNDLEILSFNVGQNSEQSVWKAIEDLQDEVANLKKHLNK